MPKGEFDTPGPFTMKRISRWTRYIYWRQHLALTVATGQDEAEGEEMLGLLNKGTHFEALVDAVRLAKHAMDSTFMPGPPGHAPVPAFGDTHPAMKQIDAALAAAEGRGKSDG